MFFELKLRTLKALGVWLVLLVVFDFSTLLSQENKPPHNWNSPSEVEKNIRKRFSTIQSYSADFKIQTKDGKSTRTMEGVCLYKKPGKVRYDFTQPEGDTIVSDGKTLWIYIKKLQVVGKQDLTIQKDSKSGPVFVSNTPEGLNRLFRKYHYKFDSIHQPRTIDPKDPNEYFVLAMEQREKIGGFEKMTLYVDAVTYMIRRADAVDGRGKETSIQFYNLDINRNIEDGLFNFHPSGNAKIVNNPLVTED